MSAAPLNPLKAEDAVVLSQSSLELVRLSVQWQKGLEIFFDDLKSNGDDVFFSPHAIDSDSIRRVATADGDDVYYLLVEQGNVLGYGLLRGWDEGYLIPSLGVAIHPSARGQGVGRMLMDLLHLVARRRGAEKVRLRVRSDNEKALHLYLALGYEFVNDDNQPGFLVGFKSLG